MAGRLKRVFEFVSSGQAAVQVFERLRQSIVALEIVPGTAINRAELQMRFGLSSTPIRDALMRLAEDGLSFDFSAVYPHHLQHVPAVAQALPELTMIIDHLGAPPIKDHAMGDWADQLAAAARHPNVYAKLSGLVTSADHTNWTVADLVPYVDFALEHFGADRLMFGSDWPVCTLAADYSLVHAALHQALAPRTPAERAAIFGGTAARVYRLAAPAA